MSEARKWYFKHLLFYFFVIPKEKLKVTALPELELCDCCTLIEKHVFRESPKMESFI